ncbi:uncharacterized protein LOC119457656 isoform X1 [Dermacentor silvarum]|uniref:uncharacterized protein LOC119457656 isoform X1 n=1 Tax=Dermacentor silvarum TaxID=543639 RepID=UPI0021017DE6|nr:uncharacterized protein LOC119457656 isoform X1 [Dermacentor silvarum]
MDDGRSPGELLQGRHLRTALPRYHEDPGVPVAKYHQSSKGKLLPPLKEGSSVRIRNGDWSRAATVSKKEAPRSYMVKTEDQWMLRRNKQHLVHTPGNVDLSPQEQPHGARHSVMDPHDCNS